MASAENSGALVHGNIGASSANNAATSGTFAVSRATTAVRTLPSFVVLGPPRTGTTWLYDILHSRAVLPGPTKETRFFDLHFERGLDWYSHHFPPIAEPKVVGEVAPTYFASPQACARILSVLPHARLVIIFRNPVERVLSLYRLKRAYGMHAWSLETALERDPELLESSQYATHLKMWQSCFAPEQLCISFFDDLSADPQSFLDRICAFIGVPRFELKQSDRDEVFSSTRMTEPRLYAATRAALSVADWCKARKLDSVVHCVKKSRAFSFLVGGGAPFSAIPRESLAKLHETLLPQTEELEAVLGRDLSAWKTAPAA